LPSKYIKIKICRKTILPIVLYGCETWSLTLRKEHRLRMFENGVQRKKFGSKRNDVTGEWRRLYNGELNDVYCSRNVIQLLKSGIIKWAGHVTRMGERGEVRIAFWRGDPMERDQVEDLAVDGRSYSAVNFLLISVLTFCLVLKGFIC
jgi:hypothetical protein